MTKSAAFSCDSMRNRLLVAIYLRADEDGLVARTNLQALSDALGRDRQEVAADIRELVRLGHVSELESEAGSNDEVVLVLMDHEAAHWYVSETRLARVMRRALEISQAAGSSNAASIN